MFGNFSKKKKEKDIAKGKYGKIIFFEKSPHTF